MKTLLIATTTACFGILAGFALAPKPQALPEITIGQGECSWTGPLFIWQAMNEIGVYNWVAECEETQ